MYKKQLKKDVKLVEEFNAYRSKMNEKLLGENSKIIKRIFNLDANTYQEGALDPFRGTNGTSSLNCFAL